MTPVKYHRAFAEDFLGFVGKVFHTLHPGQPFYPAWYLSLMGDYLQAARRGDITRLMINLPPRSLKSVTVSVAWPAFLLGHLPQSKIISASYSQMIAEKHSLDCRAVMQAEWYRHLFPATMLSAEQNEKHKFLTSLRGMRLATSLTGSLTGEGGDWLIADDPMNPLQARSALARRHVNDWFDHTFSTRLNDKKRGVMVVVMQRLHVDDVCGHLLHKGGWEVLALPAIAEEPQSWQIGGRYYARAVGDVLNDSREDHALLAQARRDLGSAAFAAQYQQKPQPEAGAMVKLSWFPRV